MLLEILQNLQENTCTRLSFLIKLQAEAKKKRKRRLWHRCFPVILAKILRRPFPTEHLRWLLLMFLFIIYMNTKHELERVHLVPIIWSTRISRLIQSRYAVVWNARFDHQDHLDFVKHLINVLMICLKRFILLIVDGWLLISYGVA